MDKESKIYVAGHKGLVGSAIVRALKNKGYKNIVGKTHQELDLTNQALTREFFKGERPEYVFLAAAKVGGIAANSKQPADFIMENELIQCNIIKNCYETNVRKLMFLGSSCIYPRICPQPMKEEYVLSGAFEETNEAYAIAKISGIKMCQYYNYQYGTRYISVIPSNLYGPYDNFNQETSHVVPGLIRKMHEAKKMNSGSIEIWGTGSPVRDFMFVDDLADACVFLMENYDGREYINIGTGQGTSIKELAEIIKKVTGYNGELVYDAGKPDGAPIRVLDISKFEKTGWKHKVRLEDGLKLAYEFYMKEYDDIDCV
ncbi:MAG: GDP-L-fucose synthase [Syntrophomonas sp.]